MPYLQQSAIDIKIIQQDSVSRKRAAIHLHSPRLITTAISTPEAEDRQELEQFIHNIFRRTYGADIHSFMPQLMSLRDVSGELLAVCGLRHAHHGKLFLENYLDAPIETALARYSHESVLRESVLEVGNLAVAEPASARSLLASVSVYLHGTNSEWAVFTGIPALRNSLIKLNMHIEKLGDANISCLPEHERPAWGSYYDENPQIMAIRRAPQAMTSGV